MGNGTAEYAVERNIWILWLQGFDSAPELVRTCIKTWIDKNPGWHVHLLTEKNIVDHLDENFHREVMQLDLPPQKTANLIRLYLISRYGGVWVDADCYCARALDEWLPPCLEGDFFAFRFAADEWLEENRERPLARLVGRSTDRVLSNWLLAGRAGNPISTVFLKRHLALFQRGKFGRRRSTRFVLRLAMSVLRRNAYLASWLASERLLRTAGAFPYFVFHYHFASQILLDSGFHAAWRKVVRREGKPSIAYSKTLHVDADDGFRKDFDGRGDAPVFKLHWKLQEGAALPRSRYRALVDGEQIRGAEDRE